MGLQWKTIRATRHVMFDGKAICGKDGGYTDDDAVPCEACLKQLFEVQSAAFTDAHLIDNT